MLAYFECLFGRAKETPGVSLSIKLVRDNTRGTTSDHDLLELGPDMLTGGGQCCTTHRSSKPSEPSVPQHTHPLEYQLPIQKVTLRT